MDMSCHHHESHNLRNLHDNVVTYAELSRFLPSAYEGIASPPRRGITMFCSANKLNYVYFITNILHILDM